MSKLGTDRANVGRNRPELVEPPVLSELGPIAAEIAQSWAKANRAGPNLDQLRSKAPGCGAISAEFGRINSAEIVNTWPNPTQS